MSSKLERIPEVPLELVDAALFGTLVVFVGAGISRLIGCPSWDGFAHAVLNQLIGKGIDYHEKSLIDAIPDPRKRLSIAKILDKQKVIDYGKIFNVGRPKSDIYKYVNRFKCSFLTTNYDKYIEPECSGSEPEKAWRFYNRSDLLSANLDKGGSVIHLHGCVDNTSSMVITTKDYLNHYSSKEVHLLLTHLFKCKTVLFMGYGLDETEILEYILKSAGRDSKPERRLFILQGFFNAEVSLYKKLKEYYDVSFQASLIGFSKDNKGYEQQKVLIEKWCEKLSFNELMLVDKLEAMKAEGASKFTPSQRSALKRAVENLELQPAFFELIEGPIWFDALYEKGLMNADLIPPPLEVRPGQYQIPNWPITNFLLKFSNCVKEDENSAYAAKLWSVLVSATQYAMNNGFGNYRVWRQFAKIVRNLPLDILKDNYNEIIVIWLKDDFGKELVGDEIVAWLDNLLDSESEYSNEIAQSLLNLIYEIGFEKKAYLKEEKLEARLLFKSHVSTEKRIGLAKKVGVVLGHNAINMFIDKLEEILKVEEIDHLSFMLRPAIEDHAQNRTNDDAYNILIETIRESFSSYLDTLDNEELSMQILSVLKNEFETIARIGIYLSNCHFEKLNENVLVSLIAKRYFCNNFRHELWHFFNSHYISLEDELKEEVISIIGSLRDRQNDTEDEAILIARTAYLKALWLSSFSNVSRQAEILYQECLKIIKEEPDHPDFASYMTSGPVVHDSPITIEEMEELSRYPEDLVEYLNDYPYLGHYREPGLEGLVNMFGEFVKSYPIRVSEIFDKLKELKAYYISEIFEGYLVLLEKPSELDWNSLWEKLLGFSNDIVNIEEFWASDQDAPNGAFVGSRARAAGALSSLIGAGCKHETHSISIEDIPITKQVLETILKNQAGEEFGDDNDSDAVSTAINSPRGKCLEAYINLAFFDAKSSSNKSEVVSKYIGTFEIELCKADQALPEFEFATLAPNYFPVFVYLSKEWVIDKMLQMFSTINRKKWLCAIQGFSYAPQFVPQVYQYLKDNGHLIAILDAEEFRGRLDDRYIELIGIAYYHHIEKVEAEDSTLLVLVKRNNTRELGQLIWFIWTLRRPETFERAKEMAYELFPLILRIIDFEEPEGQKLASKLCHWTVFIDILDHYCPVNS